MVPLPLVFLVSVSWTLFKSPCQLDKLAIESILGKGDQLFKYLGKFRYLVIEDLPQEILIEGFACKCAISRK